MTTRPRQDSGYRGSLPPRTDRLARAWVAVVAAIFVAVFVLAIVGLPSRLFPEPTPVPIPSLPAASSPPQSSSPAPTSVSPSVSPSLSASPTPTP